jgi:hypothetical protein
MKMYCPEDNAGREGGQNEPHNDLILMYPFREIMVRDYLIVESNFLDSHHVMRVKLSHAKVTRSCSNGTTQLHHIRRGTLTQHKYDATFPLSFFLPSFLPCRPSCLFFLPCHPFFLTSSHS